MKGRRTHPDFRWEECLHGVARKARAAATFWWSFWRVPSAMPSHILFLSGGCHPCTQPPMPDTKLPFSLPFPLPTLCTKSEDSVDSHLSICTSLILPYFSLHDRCRSDTSFITCLHGLCDYPTSHATALLPVLFLPHMAPGCSLRMNTGLCRSLDAQPTVAARPQSTKPEDRPPVV